MIMMMDVDENNKCWLWVMVDDNYMLWWWWRRRWCWMMMTTTTVMINCWGMLYDTDGGWWCHWM